MDQVILIGTFDTLQYIQVFGIARFGMEADGHAADDEIPNLVVVECHQQIDPILQPRNQDESPRGTDPSPKSKTGSMKSGLHFRRYGQTSGPLG